MYLTGLLLKASKLLPQDWPLESGDLQSGHALSQSLPNFLIHGQILIKHLDLTADISKHFHFGSAAY